MISMTTSSDGTPQTRNQAVTESPQSRVTARPIPQSQARDPRQYQMEQLRKRFSPQESTAPDGSTSFMFKLHPSDPDFPFELAYLDCDLRIPKGYPKQRPALLVRNKDIPRGFSINVEKGWDNLVSERTGSTLLTLTNALDKNLERFLSEEKAETVKLVAFHGVKDTRHVSAKSQAQAESAPATTLPTPPPAPQDYKPYIPEESYTREQIAEAKNRRAQEVRQLEARMGRMNMFRRSADGIVYTLPIEPKRRNDLSSGLRSVRSLHLIVPLLYPLQDIRIQLNEVDDNEAEPVEELFFERAAAHKQMTLMSHVNFLAQNLNALAKQAQERISSQAAAAVAESKAQQQPQQQEEPRQETTGPASVEHMEKSHIQVIPRPPEWSALRGEGESDSDDMDSDEADGGVELGGGQPEDVEMEIVEDTPERGTMISFPSVELYGIELLQVSILGITVKCDRCKTINEVTGLKAGVEKTLVCKKCTSVLAAKFRPQLVHQNSTRAGFIDLSGCKVADMLPSTFVPTCAKCSSSGFGLVSVRGESMSNVCRECHAKFSLRIPDIKFLLITPGSLPPPQAGPQRKRERLGLHAGEALPQRGACAHYRKSYRWFRFSCCSRVHACDKCHDDAEDHINEWANRMICGWCSREQNYAVEACGMCGRSVIGKKGRGFWEGGRGTRDQRLMSRKDPRKYKRIGTSS